VWRLTHEKEHLKMKITRRLLLVLLVLAVVAIPTAVVVAKELSSLTITGPGIKGELSLNDPDFMMKLEQSGFFDQAVLTKAPTDLNLDAGYGITAVLNLDGKMTPFVQMVYYATEEGQPGYVHYTSRLKGDSLQPVDEWNILSRSADDTFRAMMAANKITLQSALVAATVKSEAPVPAPAVAQPGTAPVAPRATLPTPYILLAVSAMIVLLIGAGLAIRRRTVSASS
jgi:hypothetical protein